jgi:hypothetical protein
VTLYQRRGLPPRFTAETHFRILPAAGPVPAACIEPATQVQSFFPGEMEVELSIVPSDELPYLIEDSFELPPIDLTLPVAQRDPISIMVLAPVPRAMLRSRIAALGSLVRPLKPITLIGQGPLRPLDRLGITRIALADVAAARRAEAAPATEAWAALLRELTQTGTDGQPQVPYLWYVRRRTLRENADLESVLIAIDNSGGTPAPDIGEDDPVPADPEPGTPDPGPSEPPVDPLIGLAREVVVRMADFGDLQRVAERVFAKMPEEAQEGMAKAIGEGALLGTPLPLAAVVMRAGESLPDSAAAAADLVTPLVKANQIGMRLLSGAVVGPDGGKFSTERLKELQIFFADERLERAANAIGKLESGAAKEAAAKLASVLPSASEELLEKTIQGLEAAAAEPPPVTPRPGTPTVPDDDRLRREAEAAAALQRQVTALVKSLPDAAQGEQLAKALDKADPAVRGAVATQLDAASIGKSRIATAVALDGLATGGSIGEAELARIKPVSPAFVEGLASIEPPLLETEDGGRGGVPTVDPLLGTRVRGTAERRIGLIVGSGRAATLAEIGRLLAGSPRKLADAAKRLIEVLDDARATTTSVSTAIQLMVRELR